MLCVCLRCFIVLCVWFVLWCLGCFGFVELVWFGVGGGFGVGCGCWFVVLLVFVLFWVVVLCCGWV